MEFDRWTVVLLESRSDAPTMDEATADAIQDAHMDHLATLHERGSLQAAGPFLVPPDSSFRGLCVSRLPPEEIRALMENDPAVRSGRLTLRVLPWMVPRGAIAFSPARFPHSQREI
jgi:uncharacterized protein